MFKKIKSFFIKILPTKRRLIQLYAALLYNANIKGFITGDIFEGVSKSACLPGLNCYSCPGAVGACPLGSLQNALSESKTKFPTYVLGIILLYSIILGRTICGFLCPVGFLQELLYKIKSPKLKKNKITRVLSYFKYVILVVLVIILPLMYALQAKNIPLPAFCKYICPAGTFEGAILILANPNKSDFYSMLGPLFTWKFILLILFIVCSVFVFRFFCRFFCPLGALYGLFNKLSILGVKVDKSKCNHCEACITNCKMDVKEVGDHECIQCGECKNVCKCNAIDWKTIHKLVKEDLNKEKLENLGEETREKTLNKRSQSTENEYINEKERKKRDFRINRRIFNVLVSSCALVLLIVVLISVNFRKEVLKISETCEELQFELYDEYEFDIKENNNGVLLYFIESINDNELDILKEYADEKLSIILVASHNVEITDLVTEDAVLELKQLNINFAVDNKKRELLSKFSDSKEYNYTVYIDFDDKVLIKNTGFISPTDYKTIVLPTVMGHTVGNKVGNICINKEINLIGSDEVFSLEKNKGKVVVMNFWYTSCTPCVKELPFFNKVYNEITLEYGDVLSVIAIHEAGSYYVNPDSVKNYIDTQFAGYNISFGYDDVLSPYYIALGGEQAWPTTVIVNQEGIISYVSPGSLTEEKLRSEIEALLK